MMKKDTKTGVIGASIAASRVELGLEEEDVHSATGLSIEFIQQVESGSYEQLSHDAYTLAGFKKLAEYVGLDKDKATAIYLDERGEPIDNTELRRSHEHRPSIVTSTLLARVTMFMAIAGISAYIFYQVLVATSSPDLEIVFPNENQEIKGESVELVGRAEPSSTVTIDAQGVSLEDDGSFTYELFLPPGTHTVVIEAESDLGRSTTVTRTFVVHDED